MSISAKQYAQGFFALASKVSDQSKIDELAVNFITVLQNNFDFKKRTAIISELEVLASEEQNKATVNIVSAKKLAETDIKHLAVAVKKAGKYARVDVKTEVNKDLICGLKLQIGWQVVDATLKTKLNKLRESLV